MWEATPAASTGRGGTRVLQTPDNRKTSRATLAVSTAQLCLILQTCTCRQNYPVATRPAVRKEHFLSSLNGKCSQHVSDNTFRNEQERTDLDQAQKACTGAPQHRRAAGDVVPGTLATLLDARTKTHSTSTCLEQYLHFSMEGVLKHLVCQQEWAGKALSVKPRKLCL